ncbi:MAG: L-histidine N(alpha)-methyltransferase [Terriglobia bacterium]|jgi:dimethylhistidine N-methyltransferase|nr:L-histidine N(alpha)-methyltransferase [Terriglobia bacterium]
MRADRAQQILSPMAMDVAAGLLAKPKRLSPKYFYDAAGSVLFEEITRLPEYYLTATEHSILTSYARDILQTSANGHPAPAPPEKLIVLELGAGSAAKTLVLLRELQTMQEQVRFVPIDVSHSALEDAVQRINEALPAVEVCPEVLDYTESLAGLEQVDGRKLVLYIGSSIGNFEPFYAGSLLRNVALSLKKGDAVLLGTDMCKPKDVLLRAYNDSRGVTAAFNKNILRHINRELRANFDVDSFRHRAIWNANESRIEMHLESVREQTVFIAALSLNIHFERGETIHTENSYKFTMTMIRAIAENGGFQLERTWSDPQGWFTVHLLRV